MLSTRVNPSIVAFRPASFFLMFVFIFMFGGFFFNYFKFYSSSFLLLYLDCYAKNTSKHGMVHQKLVFGEPLGQRWSMRST